MSAAAEQLVREVLLRSSHDIEGWRARAFKALGVTYGDMDRIERDWSVFRSCEIANVGMLSPPGMYDGGKLAKSLRADMLLRFRAQYRELRSLIADKASTDKQRDIWHANANVLMIAIQHLEREQTVFGR